jgi:predicted PurR-regulated permease PerM
MNVRNIEEIGRMLIRNLQSIGGVMVKVIIGLILSYIFIMERNSIRTFVNKIRMSSFGFFYEEYASLGGKIANGFGRIMEAQMIIALVNATLTALGLLVISFVHG